MAFKALLMTKTAEKIVQGKPIAYGQLRSLRRR